MRTSLSLFGCIPVILLASCGSPQKPAATPEPPATAPAQPEPVQPEAPAEPAASAQGGSNLKVLPASWSPDQVKQFMKEKVSAGLGVRCDACHVMGDTPDFASDAKPEKETARRMMTMVAELNAKQFEGEERITCFTCHQGKQKPTLAAE